MSLAAIPWDVFLSPFGIPIVAIVCVFTWLIVDSIAENVGKVLRHRSDNELKLELLAQGLSGDEVIRVVQAGREGDDGDGRSQSVRAAVVSGN